MLLPRAIPWRTRLLHRLSSMTGSIADLPVEELHSLRMPQPRGRLADLASGYVARDVRISDALVPVRDDRHVRVRRYDSALHTHEAIDPQPRPLLVFIHGGGWVLGLVENYDALCTYLAQTAGVIVASIEYRLAPEHPAPAAIHDCVDVMRALPELAPEWGADPSRIAVAGDSAGGNLAAVVTQVMRDTSGPPLAAQVLLYPSVDCTCLSRSKIEFAHGPILKRRDTDRYFAYYLGDGPDALRPDDPLISPALADLRGLPPALIQTAGLDPLRDEGAAYARSLRAVGVPAQYTDFPLAPHGFASWPALNPGVGSHRGEIVAFLRRHLDLERESEVAETPAASGVAITA